jgi:hypothetical protein
VGWKVARSRAEVSLSMMENFPLPFSRRHHSVKFESARAPVGLLMMENFPLASYNDRRLLKAEFARTLTSKSQWKFFHWLDSRLLLVISCPVD